MNTIIKKIIYGLLALLTIAGACKPEEFEMGNVIPKEDLSYSITQNAEDPNMVILESFTKGANPMWITPMGRSTRTKDTVLIPFEGDYQFVYGVTSAGGFVQADTFNLTITTSNLSYINDPIWSLLAGGPGESKTWVLDLFPEEEAPNFAKFFKGPLYFYDTYHYWDNVTNGAPVDYPADVEEGADWGYWEADWKGNSSWLFGGEQAEDYGTMTFNLIGGANLIVNHKVLDRQESGTYFIDTKKYTMKSTDAYILHDAGRDGQVVDWGDIRILSLTENTMQLAALRDEALSGEGPSLLVYNFISKEYSDNWVPEDLPDPEPELPEGWEEDISQTVNTTIQWKLSDQNPLDWANLDGSLMNGWQTPEDYPDWLGTPDLSVYGDFSMTFNSAEGTVEFVTPDGTTTNGSYSIDEKGIYSFDITVPTFQLIEWANFGPDANNQLRILQIEKDAGGNVTGMWLGAKDAVKPEYMAYHLVPQAAGEGGEEDPLAPWKKAFVGKTFTPDVYWFVDWVGFPPVFEGGWTNESTFGDDYTSNNWVWDADVRAVAESTSLFFFMEGDQMKMTLSQTKEGVAYTATGDVTINTDENIMNISIPLVDYAGTVASWLPTLNSKTITASEYDYYYVGHGGSNLANIDEEGFWLGLIANSTAAGDDKDEAILFRYTLKQ